MWKRVTALLCLLGALLCFCGCAQTNVRCIVNGKLVSEQEFEVYNQMAKKLTKERDPRKLHKQAIDCAARCHAVVDLAIQYDVIPSFDFDHMARELDDRNAASEYSHSIYGRVKYDLYEYYIYLLSGYEFATKDRIARQIAENPAMEDTLRSYYEKHKQMFACDGGRVIYAELPPDSSGEDAVVREAKYDCLLVNDEELGQLGEFLMTAEPGSELTLPL